MLLTLPSELLLDIFFCLDATSLSAILATCSRLRSIISRNESLLRHHLALLPGFPGDIIALTGKELLRRFQSQAALHLQHVSVLMPDAVRYSPSRTFDIRRAIIEPCKASGHDHLHIAAYCTTDECIYLYRVDPQTGPTLQSVIPAYQSDVKLILSHLLFLTNEDRCPHSLAVLYYSQFSVNTSHGDTTCYGRTINIDGRMIDGRRLMLLEYHLDKSLGPFLIDEECIPIRRCENSSTLQWPTALAYNQFLGAFTIAVTAMNGRLYRSVLYLTQSKKESRKGSFAEDDIFDPPPPYHIELGGQEQEAYRDIIASTIQHREHGLMISPPNFPMPNLEVSHPWHRRYRFTHHAIDTSLPQDAQSTFYRQLLGTTLDWRHICSPNDATIEFGCATATLQVVFSIDDRWERRTGVFLVKGVEGVEACTTRPPTFDPMAEHLIVQHSIVAKLEGINIYGISSIGIKMCIAPSKRRIAMSNWKSVYVWAVEPNAFLDPYRLSDWDAMGDPSYLEDCGHEYHENSVFIDDTLILLPIELPSRGVVYSMEFNKDDELWAWTEQGLVKWSFGTECNSSRATFPMDKEPPSLRKRKHAIVEAETSRESLGRPMDWVPSAS